MPAIRGDAESAQYIMRPRLGLELMYIDTHHRREHEREWAQEKSQQTFVGKSAAVDLELG